MLTSSIPEESCALRPNLFQFATSELSQDAFICWLISHLQYDGDLEMTSAARGFIEMLYQKAYPDVSLTGKKVRLIPESLRRQYQKIDVYFQIEIDGKVISFIIEDKVDTSEHSNQTSRYLDAIRSDDIHEDEIIGIYYKTGYLFKEDLAMESTGFHVLGVEELFDFLSRQHVSNPIFRDYREFIEARANRYRDSLARLESPDGFEAFSEDFCQYEFMKRLAQGCPENLGAHWINRGRNIGGTPWTQLWFVEAPNTLPGGHSDAIFYRIDVKLNRNHPEGKKWGYYLSMRYYSYVQGNPTARADKVNRLNKYRELFEEARQEARTTLKFSPPAADYQGANESEIGLLFFDAQQNTIQGVLRQLPLFHRAFVERVEKSLTP